MVILAGRTKGSEEITGMYKEFSSGFLFLSFLFMTFFLSNLFCSHPTIPFSLFPVFLRCNPGILSIPTQTRLPPCLCAGCNSTSPSSHYCFRHSLHFLFSFPFHSLSQVICLPPMFIFKSSAT